jgi:hypothetical protein
MNIKYIDIIQISSFNKFTKSNITKFRSQNISPISGLTPTMVEGLATAIPIWQLLNITEEQYDKLYKTPIVDVSNSIIEELEKSLRQILTIKANPALN